MTFADGVVVSTTEIPDPRFGAGAATASSVTTTPGGVQRIRTIARSATLSNPADPLTATSLIETVTVNGRASVSTYDAATRMLTTQSPAGRTTAALLDAQSRILEVRPPGYSTGAVWPVQFAYDADGRLSGTTQGSRTITIGYDAQGYPATFTDPLQRTTQFWRDAAGRVIDQGLLGNRHVTVDYDQSGNVTALTPPDRPAHGFSYTPISEMASYTPPPAASTDLLATSYTYNFDGALAQVRLPDESTITHDYDAAGQLASVTTAWGTTIVGYDAAGRVGSLIAPDGGEVSFGYDGFLKTGETWTGTVSGTVGYTYDSDFRVVAVSVNGTSDSYQYDPDGLLAQAGALTIARDAATGWIIGTTASEVTTNQSSSQYGELSSFSARASGAEIFAYTLERDGAGRIIGKTETVGGTTTAYAYAYDDAGRLSSASRNGITISVYTYDANGNRLTGPGAETGTYDKQDRMLAYDAATYGHGPSGDLRSKTEGGQTTSYAYDALGNLVAAALPNGATIEYVIDGANRRIGKKVNGQLVEGFLYEGQLRPVAWLNGSGQVYARFVYGARINGPEYMVTAAGTFRFITDHLGSPRLVVDTATGAVMERIDYDEWGHVLADSNPGLQPFGFAGGLYDRDTGLVRFGARDYDPHTGRWTSKDPILFGGGLNVYAYTDDDPMNRLDPGGLWGFAINLDLDVILPFLSGGGGSAGFSFVYSSDFGLGFYSYRPTSTPSEGFSVGASVQVCAGPGEGPWSGLFDTWGGNIGAWGGGYYESAGATPGEPSYSGIYGSWGIGAPIGGYYSQTDYTPIVIGR
jgi:RHS repeat-associated protein